VRNGSRVANTAMLETARQEYNVPERKKHRMVVSFVAGLLRLNPVRGKMNAASVIAGRNNLAAVRPSAPIKAAQYSAHQGDMAVAPGAAARGNAHTQQSNHRKDHSPISRRIAAYTPA
jgi:hypothetical protein